MPGRRPWARSCPVVPSTARRRPPLARRHGDALAPAHVSGWSLAVWSLLLARRPTLALAVLAASIALLARRLRGLVRDPVRVATHIAGGGTTRAALPMLASLTRTWSPALVLGLAFRRTRRVSAVALLLPALADVSTDSDANDPVRAPWPCTLPTMSPTAPASGSAAPASGSSRRSSRVFRGAARVWSSSTLREELQH